MIEIQDLVKYYGDRRAVGPLSFSIAKGEIVGLLGLNGAGKTTTLRVLACDLLPSSGRVVVDGLDVVDQPDEVRTRIGYLPDHPPLYEEMTVHDYLVFAARLRGVSRKNAPKRADEAEGATQLGDVRYDLISTLSHGFRQRVGIAQAIVHGPKLLVLDEPISGLDPVQIVEMRELLKGIRSDHTTLFSSHILSEISETCDRILVIRNGEIVASGTEAELSNRLLGGMNLVVTFRGDAALASVTVRKVSGVTTAEPAEPSETGPGVAGLRVVGSRDVREEVCRALVNANVGLLEVTRGERELESIFLRLAGPKAGTDTAAAPAAPNKEPS